MAKDDIKDAAAVEEIKKAAEAKERAARKRFNAACKAYGIDEKYILKRRIHPDGRVVVVTRGGAKVFWFEDMKDIEPLGPIRVTGVNPENAKRKPIAGKARDK